MAGHADRASFEWLIEPAAHLDGIFLGPFFVLLTPSKMKRSSPAK
jgi:hypothetical protein